MSLLDDLRTDIGDDDGNNPSGIVPSTPQGLPIGANSTIISDLRADIGDDDNIIPSGEISDGVIVHNLLSSAHGDTTPGSPQTGDLIVGGSPWQRLPSGVIGQRLTVTGGSPGVGWVDDVSATGVIADFASHTGNPSAHHARYTDVEASGVAVQVATTGIQEAIGNHTSIVDAHHTRYTDQEASGVAVQVATTGIQEAITNHASIVDAHHSRYTDTEASGVAVQVATTGIQEAITNHTAQPDAHHTRYSDAEASGVAVQVATTGIQEAITNHTSISDAHHSRYTDTEASGVAVQIATTGIQEAISNHASISDAHHARYTDTEASGVAVQVATTGIQEAIGNHTGQASAHHTRYTDAEAIAAATGNVTLQTAYDASTSPDHVVVNATQGTLTVRDNAVSIGTIAAIENSAGVQQHWWTPTSVNFGSAVTDIFAASLVGVNFTPTLFPTRPTVNINLDQLNLLPSPRTITSNFTKISFSSTYTLNFAQASFGAAVGVDATVLLRQNGGAFGMGLLFNNATTWSNDSGFAVNLGSAFSFVDQPTYRADGQSITQPVVRSMISQPKFLTINGGSLSVTEMTHYYAAGTVQAGTTVATRRGLWVLEPTILTGTLTSNIGIEIENLTAATTVRGILLNCNNGLGIEHIGTAPSEHTPEFRIGSTLAHIGDVDTNISFTFDQIDFNAGGVNLLRLDEAVQDIVHVNPTAADVDFRVDGDSVNNMIFVQASDNSLGVYGGGPVPQSGGFDPSFETEVTTLSATTGVTLSELTDFVKTLAQVFLSRGDIGS